MGNFTTEQEYFWAGDFGNDYAARNSSDKLFSSNISLFSTILKHTHDVKSVIEFGANIGLNLNAIKYLLPQVELSAVEINQKASKSLQANNIKTYVQSIFNFSPTQKYDFVLTKGLLIHVNPEQLPKIYQTIYKACKHYICVAEYYNPTPIEKTYRGHDNKLFKRDFAGDLLDQFSDLKLLDYGFVYHRDNHFPQDDITWFVLEKSLP